MLRRAESIGVFQLEGGAMRATLRSLAPTSFDDVAALVALYRPGPMAANMHRDYPELKNKRKAVTYLHPDLEGTLVDPTGLMLYQESVMRVAQRFAGYTLEDADNLRKACGKKVRALIAAERGSSSPAASPRATRSRSAPRCSTSSSPSPTTPSTSPTPTPTLVAARPPG